MYSYFYWLKNFNVKNGLLTGFILGIITLTRATTQFFPFIVLITIFWHKKGIKKITINYICFIIAFALVLAPWVYRNYLVTGTANLIVSSDYGYALWEKTQFDFDMLVHRDSKTYSKIVSELNTINQSHDGNNYKAADTMVRIFLDDLIKNPSKHIFLYFKQLIAFWYIAPSKTISIINMLINFPFLILGVMGLKKALKNGITVTPFIALITYFNLLHAIVWVFFRYAIPLMPYLMIFSSYFLLTNKYFYSSRLEERKMELSV